MTSMPAPLALAALAARLSGADGPALVVVAPLAVLLLLLSGWCWRRTCALERDLAALGEDGDDQDGWRWSDWPLSPDDPGGGGAPFDWEQFEREFRLYALERDPIRV